MPSAARAGRAATRPRAIFGSPWHLIDPTHVRGFHPLNFDYFIQGRELFHKFGHFYFDFAYSAGDVQVEGHNIVATLRR